MSSETGPRFHHYLFAHRILPHFAFLEGVDIFQTLENEKEKCLRQLWNLASEEVDKAACLPFSGFKIYFVKTLPHVGAVIVLPEPKNMSEAHMVLFVKQVEEKYTGTLPPKYRYFTLEYGKDSSNTILCELSGGQYVIYGAGPSVDIRKFWAAALGIINADVISRVPNVK